MNSGIEEDSGAEGASSKLTRGTYRDLTKEQMDAEGIVRISKRLLRCLEERSLCIYDNNVLDEEVRGEIIILKRCRRCGTMYYSSPEPKEATRS